ncbi:MAG TPA: DNA polymerase IV [Chloroflexota bacterium]|jgi:DNA polymerase-4|nr:DNA polymerase IV [Chloroflexota bacterium]
MGCVLYLDADRFFFSVEALERPELATDPRPIVIAHDPREAPRAVVTTANDAARELGITSALSAALALRRAPNALFLPPRHDLYARYSRRLMELLRSESRLVQQNSIDEAALAWEHGFEIGPALRLRERIGREIGLSVSLGVAPSPLVGKMASEVAKGEPGHVRLVRPGEEPAFLAPMPIRALIGVGPKAEARLRQLGVETIGDLQARELAELVDRFGQAYGRYLHRASRGQDDSELSDEREPKSISAERTFGHDTTDRRRLWEELQGQADEVAARLRSEDLVAGEVAIKVRYASWETFTRQMRLAQPTDQAAALAAAAAALLRRHWDRTRPIRLLGVRAGRLAGRPSAVQPALPLDS